MATPTPATLDEFLSYLNKDPSPPEQTELLDTLEGATEAAEGWHDVGPIVAREFTDRVPADTGILLLPRKPVQSVTSATRISDGLAYLTAALDVDKVGGIVAGQDEIIPAGDYTVVYTAGRNPVPVSLKQAVLIIAGHHWQTQQNSARRNRFVGSEDESGVRVSMGYLIPNRAAHLLQKHALVP
ncbi:MAG TPA: hypothetical protein VFR23_13830 [Jiangellaceae bacterium]|nr:hypothetical protein [Jiangellaceae bacterium]